MPDRRPRTSAPATGAISPSDLKRARLKFALTFAVVAGTLLALYSFPYAQYGLSESFFEKYLSAYARMTATFLQIGDPSVHVVGRQIVGRFSLTVVKDCDAMDVNILLAAAMMAFPSPWPLRVVGIAAGVALLLAANVARLVTLYQIGARWPRAFDVMHTEVWPLALAAFAVTVFVVWARWAARAARHGREG
jgi:exosortase/archaeosortase family protein